MKCRSVFKTQGVRLFTFFAVIVLHLKNNLCLAWKWPNDTGDPASTKFKPLTVIRGWRDFPGM